MGLTSTEEESVENVPLYVAAGLTVVAFVFQHRARDLWAAEQHGSARRWRAAALAAALCGLVVVCVSLALLLAGVI